MIFVDTNYLVHFFLADNQDQYQKAKTLFDQAASGKRSLYTSVIVFFEIYWVFTKFYKKQPTQVFQILKNILEMNFIKIENDQILREALNLFEYTGYDLEDAYHLAFCRIHQIDKMSTFDQKLQRKFKLLKQSHNL